MVNSFVMFPFILCRQVREYYIFFGKKTLWREILNNPTIQRDHLVTSFLFATRLETKMADEGQVEIKGVKRPLVEDYSDGEEEEEEFVRKGEFKFPFVFVFTVDFCLASAEIAHVVL